MKEKKDRFNSTLLLIVIFIILLLIIAFGITKLSGGDGVAVTRTQITDQAVQTSPAVTTTVVTTSEAVTQEQDSFSELDIDDYDLYSKAAVLMDKDENVIYSFNEDERIYPASLTKIMTAIVAIENIDDFDATVSVPGDIFDYINAEQASTAGFSAYETVSYNDLLHGTLLSSGAECSLTLAVYIGGSEDFFVDMMNDKAKEIGMENTHFTNACGLHSYEHYSTASDIALLLNYALKNDVFRRIFTTSEYYTTTDIHPDGITLKSTMFMQMDSSYFDGGEILGGKTGYTSEAGLCLASLAEIDGEEYTLVTAGADGSYATESFNIYDAFTVYNALSECQNNLYN